MSVFAPAPQPTEGDEVMARLGPDEVVPGFVTKVESDSITVAVFDGTTEIERPEGDVWLNGGYEIREL